MLVAGAAQARAAVRGLPAAAGGLGAHAARPQALAAAGLYFYAHVGDSPADPYRRIAGPTVPADLADLEPLVHLLASRVALPVSFEAEASLAIHELTICGA